MLANQAAHKRPAAVRDGWTRLDHDIGPWNRVLRETDAPLYQYPYWNEPLRQIRLSPEYLVYYESGTPAAYVCMLQLGLPRMRIGIVRGGPVSLNGALREAAIDGLVRWASAAGYVFVRFSHANASLLETLANHGIAERGDPFPFYPQQDHDLIVEQAADEKATLDRFQSVARRNIRDARKVDYRIERGDTAADLERAFPLFNALNARKGQVYSRPMSSYVDLVRLAAPHAGARIYTAVLEGVPIQVLLIVRDRDTAHYVIGAMDVERLGERPSPGCLLHWHAMRDFYSEGTRFYNLGSWGSGGLKVFKSKFRPVEVAYPPPVTLILQPTLYRMWSRMLPFLRNSRPRIEKLFAFVGELRGRAAM